MQKRNPKEIDARNYVAELGVTKVARDLGVSESMVRRWKSGTRIADDRIIEIFELYQRHQQEKAINSVVVQLRGTSVAEPVAEPQLPVLPDPEPPSIKTIHLREDIQAALDEAERLTRGEIVESEPRCVWLCLAVLALGEAVLSGSAIAQFFGNTPAYAALVGVAVAVAVVATSAAVGRSLQGQINDWPMAGRAWTAVLFVSLGFVGAVLIWIQASANHGPASAATLASSMAETIMNGGPQMLWLYSALLNLSVIGSFRLNYLHASPAARLARANRKRRKLEIRAERERMK